MRPNTSNIVIASYDMLVTYKDLLKSVTWDLVVGDEIHLCKERTAKRTRSSTGTGKGLSVLLPALFVAGYSVGLLVQIMCRNSQPTSTPPA